MKKILLISSFLLMGQISLCVLARSANCETLLKQITDASDATARTAAISTLVRLGNNPVCFAEIVDNSPAGERGAYAVFLKYLELHRTDKQAGSSVGTGGTTNLVSKGVTAKALSVAAEYG